MSTRLGIYLFAGLVVGALIGHLAFSSPTAGALVGALLFLVAGGILDYMVIQEVKRDEAEKAEEKIQQRTSHQKSMADLDAQSERYTDDPLSDDD